MQESTFCQLYRNERRTKVDRNTFIEDLHTTPLWKLVKGGQAFISAPMRNEIKASKEYCKRKGADFIRTQVFPQIIDSIRFYERNGFCGMIKTIESQL